MSNNNDLKLNSLLIHGGIDGDEITGAVNVPIYQTSTYKQDGLGKNRGWEYSRTGNPTRAALEKLIADLEHGEYGLAFASGLAAINTVLSLFKSGDKLVVSDNIYGGTFRILDNVFKNFNITYKIVNTSDLEAVENAIDDDVKAVYIETPANPLLTITPVPPAFPQLYWNLCPRGPCCGTTLQALILFPLNPLGQRPA